MSETYKLNWDYSPKVEEIWIAAEYRVSSTWDTATEAFIDRGTALTIDGTTVSWTFNNAANDSFVGGTVNPPASTVYYRFTVYARYANGDVVALNWDTDNPGGGRPTMSGYTVATPASDSVQYLTVVFKSQSAYLPIYVGKNWATVWSGNNQLKKIDDDDSSLSGTGSSSIECPGGFQGNINFNSSFSSAEQASTDPLKLRITWNRNSLDIGHDTNIDTSLSNVLPNTSFVYIGGGPLIGSGNDKIYYTNIIKAFNSGTTTNTSDYNGFLSAYPNVDTDYSTELWLTPNVNNSEQIAVQTQNYIRRDMYPSSTNFNEVTGIPVFGFCNVVNWVSSDNVHGYNPCCYVTSWNLIYRPADNKFYFGGNVTGATGNVPVSYQVKATPFEKEFNDNYPLIYLQNAHLTIGQYNSGSTTGRIVTLKRVEVLR